jgi:hypothetical protein
MSRETNNNGQPLWSSWAAIIPCGKDSNPLPFFRASRLVFSSIYAEAASFCHYSRNVQREVELRGRAATAFQSAPKDALLLVCWLPQEKSAAQSGAWTLTDYP